MSSTSALNLVWRQASLKLLTLLAKNPEKLFTLSEASRRSGVSFKPTLELVHELAALGIVKVQRKGRVILCSLNVNNLVGSKIKDLLDLEYMLPPSSSLIEGKVGEIIGRVPYGNEVLEVYLYGSYGTNDFVRGVSDLDLAVVVRGEAIEGVDLDFSFEVDGCHAGVDLWSERELEEGVKKGFFAPIQLVACGYPLLRKLTFEAGEDDLRAENIVPDLYSHAVRPFALNMRDSSYAIERLTVVRSMIAVSKRAACIIAGYHYKHLTRDGLEASKVIGEDVGASYRKLLEFKAGLRFKEPIQIKMEDGLPYFEEFMRKILARLSDVEKSALKDGVLHELRDLPLESERVEKDTCYFALAQLRFLDYLYDTDEVEIKPMPLKMVKEKVEEWEGKM